MAKKKFYETKSFKEEQKNWYKKLKESGFDDIESGLQQKHDTIAKQEFLPDHARVIYFDKCLTYYHATKWTDSTDAFIFYQHCMGTSNRQIEELLKKSDLKPIRHSAIDVRILKILKMAGIQPFVFTF